MNVYIGNNIGGIEQELCSQTEQLRRISSSTECISKNTEDISDNTGKISKCFDTQNKLSVLNSAFSAGIITEDKFKMAIRLIAANSELTDYYLNGIYNSPDFPTDISLYMNYLNRSLVGYYKVDEDFVDYIRQYYGSHEKLGKKIKGRFYHEDDFVTEENYLIKRYESYFKEYHSPRIFKMSYMLDMSKFAVLTIFHKKIENKTDMYICFYPEFDSCKELVEEASKRYSFDDKSDDYIDSRIIESYETGWRLI